MKRWWSAVRRRDPAWDGRFVFGVTTTAIYCRASCPARRPNRENVVFFRTPTEAEREGFRACKRCGRSGSLLAACEFIARHVEEPLTLATMARSAGWSPFHFQRVFRRALGVTPKEYLRRLRFERFARSRDLYGSGFGSPSRLYERAKEQLGMTPATVAGKGEGMKIAYDIVDSPIGKALIAATPLGLCAVKFGPGAAADLRAQFPRATIRREPEMLRFAKERLATIFEGGDPGLPIDVRATAFQAKVWASLRSIPFGETRTYAEIAKVVGSGPRAVARACASNPIALVIPCHRVVGRDGLRGYRWGLDRKRRLLELERQGART